MVRLMIVDDEQIIRMGIKNSIKWEEHGIEVVSDASNGEEALLAAEKYHPDIILTDIRMPKMDGIELIRRLQEMHNPAKVIVLTAYNDTSYYAQVIPLGIQNFVLKNACSDAILQEVVKVAEKVRQEQESRSQMEHREKLLTENMYVIQSAFLSGVLAGKESSENYPQKLEQLNLKFSGPSFALLAMEIHAENRWTITSLASKMLQPFSPFAFPYGDSIFTIILNFSDEASCRRELAELIRQIQPCCVKNRLIALLPFRDFPALSGSGALIESALESSCWVRTDEERFLSPLTKAEPFRLSEALRLEKTFLADDCAPDALADWYGYMRDTRVPYPFLQESACRICIILGSAAQQMDKASEMLGKIRSETYASEIYKDLEALQKPQSQSCAESSQLSTVLNFIRKNYRQNLTLADAARAVYLSPNYLSKIFKRETGSTFKETLNRIRIEKARELLQDPGLRHYEIAELVGYSDYKKFSEYFHKYSGCSAKEFRAGLLAARSQEHLNPELK